MRGNRGYKLCVCGRSEMLFFLLFSSFFLQNTSPLNDEMTRVVVVTLMHEMCVIGPDLEEEAEEGTTS